jgi:hypothetical protein
MVARVTLMLLGAAVFATLVASCGGGVPSDFVRYHADGYTFEAPKGLKATANPLRGLPAGASSSYILTPGNLPISQSNTQILEISNHQLRVTLDEVAAALRAADGADPTLSDVHTTVRPFTVPGARARIVSESYVGRNLAGASPATTLFKRTWLMVSPNPSTLLDLVVVTEPKRGGSLDPNAVFSTFRLGG